MTHLTPDELRGWHDGQLDHERERIVTHLAACEECASQLAGVARTMSAPAEPVAADVQAFKEAGYRAGEAGYRAGLTGAASFDWRRLAMAAVVLLVVGGGLYLAGPRQSVERGAGSDVKMESPVGDVPAAEAVRFAWTGLERPARLVVVDVSSAALPIVDREVTPPTELTQQERLRMEIGGTYHWYLEYRDAAGVLHSTPSARFSLR